MSSGGPIGPAWRLTSAASQITAVRPQTWVTGACARVVALDSTPDPDTPDRVAQGVTCAGRLGKGDATEPVRVGRSCSQAPAGRRPARVRPRPPS